MATDWYYEVDGEERGPIDFDALQDLLRRERLHPDDLVWSDDLDDWTPARKVKGLVPREARERAAPRREEHHPGSGSTPGLVIAGFICAFLCAPLGVILCAVGLGEARRNRAGVGLAWAGIVIGALSTLAPIVFAVAFSSVRRSHVAVSMEQTQVERTLRQLVQAQELYRDLDSRGQYARTLDELTSSQAGEELRTDVAGYELELRGDGRTYSCWASPRASAHASAHYFIDESGLLRREDDRRAGPDSPPARKLGARRSSDWD